jgi:hypothetical protein
MRISGWRRSGSPPAEIASSNLFGRANHGREFAIMEFGTPTFVIELCGKVGDGVNQAADLISATASIPSLNFIPLTTFGNWF